MKPPTSARPTTAKPSPTDKPTIVGFETLPICAIESAPIDRPSSGDLSGIEVEVSGSSRTRDTRERFGSSFDS